MRRSGQRIDASHHASRGFVVCTTQGVIIWQGPLSKLPRAAQIEIVHCHDEDVEQVLKILSIHPASNSSTHSSQLMSRMDSVSRPPVGGWSMPAKR
jgi:hypothetical protein